MNFDYLSGIDALGAIYKACMNAEQYVYSDAHTSVMHARRAGENVTRMLYIHFFGNIPKGSNGMEIPTKQMESELRDKTKYNPLLMSNITTVRLVGNTAVHSGTQEFDTNTSLTVLSALYCATGEACKLVGYIFEYKPFQTPQQANNVSSGEQLMQMSESDGYPSTGSASTVPHTSVSTPDSTSNGFPQSIYKICPICGKHNSPKAQYCEDEKCDTDLVNIGVTRVDEKQSEEKPPATVGRRCNDCGTMSAVTARVCEKCGTSMSAMPIVTLESSEEETLCKLAWNLTSVDGKANLVIREGEVVHIGREQQLSDYLVESFRYVGRRHASLTVRSGRAYITDEHSTNGVQVNYASIPANQETLLCDGDIISLGGKLPTNQKEAAYFYIRSERPEE